MIRKEFADNEGLYYMDDLLDDNLCGCIVHRYPQEKQKAFKRKQKIERGTQMSIKEKLPLGTAIPVRELQNIVKLIVTQEGEKCNEDFLRRRN